MNSPVFLDWDGVLIDSLELYLNLFRRLCKEHKKHLPVNNAEEFRHWYKPNWELNFAELGFTEQQYFEICRTYPDTLDYLEAPLFEGVRDLVLSLSERYPLVVVSTAPTQNIVNCLKAAGLYDRFREVTGADDGSTDKAERLRHLRTLFPEGTGIMVGDTDLDIQAGRDAGLITVGVAYGWLSEARIRASAPNHIVMRPQDLQKKLEGLLYSHHL
jgi:phosphoglycolate phosphatase